MATKKQILESDELLQQKRKAYHLSDEGFEEYKKFLSDPDQKKFCFKGYYYVEVKEQDDKELLGAMGRNVIMTVMALASQYSSPGSDPYVTNP